MGSPTTTRQLSCFTFSVRDKMQQISSTPNVWFFFQPVRSKASAESMTKLPQMKRSLWSRPLFLPEWIFLDSVDQDASGKRIYCPTGADQRAATGKTSVTKQRQPVIRWQAGFWVGLGEGASISHLQPATLVYLFIYFMALAAMWMLSNIHDQTGPLSSYDIWMRSLEAAVKSSLRWNPLVPDQCWSHCLETSSTLAQPLPSSRFHSKAFTQTKWVKTGKGFFCS